MKTQITKMFAATMLVVVSFNANATGETSERSLRVSQNNSKAVVLQLGNLAEGTEISLWGENGQLLFQDNTLEASYSKVFNLKSLQNGEIFLEIESDEKLEILPIEVTATSARIKRSAEQIIEKPVVKQNGEYAKIFFGQNGGETKVTLFDTHNDIVYRQNVAEGKGSKTYDLSKLEEGTYKFQIKTKGKTFFHTVILN